MRGLATSSTTSESTFPEDHIFTRKYLDGILTEILNKTLGEVDKNGVFKKAETNPKITGIAGDVIEQSVLGYKADSRKQHDILVDGVPTEVKTTGFRVSDDGKEYKAKEPMSITAVSPDVIVDEVFDESHFWDKLAHMLLVYYHYTSDKPVKAIEYKNFPIRGYEFHEFSEEEKTALANDWTIVRDFIKKIQEEFEDDPESQYPRLSHELRSQLMLIDTAPKWPNPPRFRLKRTFVDQIIKSFFKKKPEEDSHFTAISELDRLCKELTDAYAGKSIKELMGIFGIEDTNVDKAVVERIVVRMFKSERKKISDIPMFVKAGIHGKTLVTTHKGGRTEDMKLCNVDFDELCDPDFKFEDSALCDYFSQSQMLCILFHERDEKAIYEENIFDGFKRIYFTDEFIEKEVRRTWEEAHDLIISGRFEKTLEFNEDGSPKLNPNGTQRSHTNFPKSKDHPIFMRGTGGDSADTPLEINGYPLYRFQFWIKGLEIVKMVKSSSFKGLDEF